MSECPIGDRPGRSPSRFEFGEERRLLLADDPPAVGVAREPTRQHGGLGEHGRGERTGRHGVEHDRHRERFLEARGDPGDDEEAS